MLQILYLSMLSLPVHLEPIITGCLFDMCASADLIVEARVISQSEDNYTLEYKELFNENSPGDTLIWRNVSDYYAIHESEELRSEYEQILGDIGTDSTQPIESPLLDCCVTFGSADKAILFLYKTGNGKYVPGFGCCYLVVNNKVFYASQISIPGKLWFHLLPGTEEAAFVSNIQTALKQIAQLEYLFSIKKERVQRKAYQQWLRNNTRSLLSGACYGANSIEGWGSIGSYFYRKYRDEHILPKQVTFEEFRQYIKNRRIIALDGTG